MLKPEVPHSSLLLFPLPSHLLYKKLLIVAWCPLLLHHKHRTQHVFAFPSAASVYEVRTQSQLGRRIPPRADHTICKPFPDPINCLPSANPDPFFSLHILLGYAQGCQLPCLQILRHGLSSHLGKQLHLGQRVFVVRQKKPAIYPHVCRKPSHTTREQNYIRPPFSFSRLFGDPSSYCDCEWNGLSMTRKKETVSVAMLELIPSYCSPPYHAQHHKHMAGRSLQKPLTSLLAKAR